MAGKEGGGAILGLLDVRLVEGVDAQERSGRRRRELPELELGAEV
jgi:hypothetical protein